jgi:hypothetical protein
MAVGVGPFTAELFIAKARAEAYRFNDSGHGFAVFNLCLNFPAGLMPARLLPAAVLISQSPAGAIFAKPEKGPSSAKLAAGLVKKGIHLMGARGNQAESSCLEAGGEGVNVIDSKLDLDFAVSGHAASIRREDRVWPLPRPEKLVVAADKVTFFIIPTKKEIYL